MAAKGGERPPLAHHDSKLLDLAFGMDTTGSMASYIRAACDNVRRIVEEIVAKESSDVRLALVEYRDHPPQDRSYVTQVHDFTARVGEMKAWLQASRAEGGGDAPEAVADALHQLLKLSWRPEATKICVLISDAPPHGLNPAGDGFPNGCPDGLDPMVLAGQLAEKGVTLYVAGCEPALLPYKDFFAALAYVTGGQYVPLQAASALTPVIIGGAQEELSLEQWMEQVNQQVMAEVQTRGADNVDMDGLSRRVMADLNMKGARSNQLKVKGMVPAPVCSYVKSMSACDSLRAVRSEWKPAAAGSPGLGAAYHHSPPPTGAMCSVVHSPPEARGSRMRRGGPPLPSAAAPPMPGAPMTRSFAASAMESPEAMEVADGFGGGREMEDDFGGERETAADYGTEEGEIHFGQAQRMVQKAFMRNNIPMKKK